LNDYPRRHIGVCPVHKPCVPCLRSWISVTPHTEPRHRADPTLTRLCVCVKLPRGPRTEIRLYDLTHVQPRVHPVALGSSAATISARKCIPARHTNNAVGKVGRRRGYDEVVPVRVSRCVRRSTQPGRFNDVALTEVDCDHWTPAASVGWPYERFGADGGGNQREPRRHAVRPSHRSVDASLARGAPRRHLNVVSGSGHARGDRWLASCGGVPRPL
jgi:hypothetical protein